MRSYLISLLKVKRSDEINLAFSLSLSFNSLAYLMTTGLKSTPVTSALSP